MVIYKTAYIYRLLYKKKHRVSTGNKQNIVLKPPAESQIEVEGYFVSATQNVSEMFPEYKKHFHWAPTDECENLSNEFPKHFLEAKSFIFYDSIKQLFFIFAIFQLDKRK